MSVVRVIRVLEYEYPSHAAAEEDMANWGIPANGTRRRYAARDGSGWAMIRSATTFPAMAEDLMAEEEWTPEKNFGMSMERIGASKHNNGFRAPEVVAELEREDPTT